MIESRLSSTAWTASWPSRRLAGARYATDLVEDLPRVQQRLGRHARVKAALAADEALLHDRSGQAGSRGAAGENLAGRPGADDDDIEIRHRLRP